MDLSHNYINKFGINQYNTCTMALYKESRKGAWSVGEIIHVDGNKDIAMIPGSHRGNEKSYCEDYT